MSMHHHHHAEEPHTHGISVYEFLANLLAGPMDETLLYNVCDPGFWAAMNDRLDNEFTHESLEKLAKASVVLSEIPEDMRKMSLDAEYGQAFLGAEAKMPPLESYYGMSNGSVREFAEEFGVEGKLLSFIPADHIANELMILAPMEAQDIDLSADPQKMIDLASFFTVHPISLLRHMAEHSTPSEEGSGFYRAIVEFALAWLQWDIDAFNG